MIAISFTQTALPSVIAASDFSFFSLFLQASWVVKAVMLILVIASLWSWAIAIDKFFTFRLLKSRADKFEDTFWSGRTLEDLEAGLANDIRDPMARVFSAAMDEWNSSRSGRVQSEQQLLGVLGRIDRVMNLVVNRELGKAERGLSVLATIGSAAVFIGLFGTVWGIMTSFSAIAETQDTNLAVVAPGIAEALFATALGLIAAIPAVIFYNKFTTDLDRYGDRLQNYVDELLAIFSRKISKGNM